MSDDHHVECGCMQCFEVGAVRVDVVGGKIVGKEGETDEIMWPNSCSCEGLAFRSYVSVGSTWH